MTPGTPLHARSYLRVSVKGKAIGRAEASPDEQHAVHVEESKSHGWQLGEPYRDIGSASRYAKKARENFERLIADLTADRFDANVLMLWESSRGSRKVGEWATLIDLLIERGVKVYVTTHKRLYDPRNARDRRSLFEDAVDSAYESDKTSERTGRDQADRAAKGRPNGRAPYGYRSNYDDKTGKFLGRVVHEDEAEVIRELFTRLSKGHSILGITDDFATRGIVNGKGEPFSQAHLRTFLLNWAYAGKRAHLKGHPAPSPSIRNKDAKVTDAQWPAIVSLKLFLEVQGILHDPERMTTTGGRAVHTFTSIVKCDRCGGGMTVRSVPVAETRKLIYKCGLNGCTTIYKDAIEEIAEKAMLAYLALPEVYKGTQQEDELVTAELADVEEKLAQASRELDELGDAVGRGELSARLAARSEPRILARIEDYETRRRALTTPSALASLITPGADVAKRWASITDVAARRKIASLVLSPSAAGELRVIPGVQGVRGVPAEDRVVFIRDEPPQTMK